MRAFTLAVVLALSVTACAQERSVVVRIEQPDGAPYPHLFLTSRGRPGTVESVASLRGTPLYVAIVIEGGEDREFGPSQAARYAKWFMQDPDLKGMMAAYAPNGSATAITADYNGLLKDIAALKPKRGAADYVAEAVQYVCRVLGNQQRGQNVRRIVLLITDPAPFHVLAPSEPKKLLQIAQDSQAVLVVEDHSSFQGIAGFSMLELQQRTPGLVLRSNYPHGKLASTTSFNHQTERIARLLDELYLVGFQLPSNRSDAQLSLTAYEDGVEVYPQKLLPLLDDSYWFLTRIKMPKGVTQFGAYTKFGLRFYTGDGRLTSLISLRNSPLYVAIVVQAGGDPVFYQDLPTRYVNWFAQNPDLRGIMVAFSRDDVRKGPPPSLLAGGRTRPHITSDIPTVLQQIDDYDPNKPAESFSSTLHLAIDALAQQQPGQNVRRVLLIISHSCSCYGPSFNPMEILQLANDSEVVIAFEDHGWSDELPLYASGAIGWTGGLTTAYTNTTVWGPISSGILTMGFGFLDVISDATPGIVLHGGGHLPDEGAKLDSFQHQTKKLALMLEELYRFRVFASPSASPSLIFRLVTNGSYLKLRPQFFSLQIDRRWEGDIGKTPPPPPKQPVLVQFP